MIRTETTFEQIEDEEMIKNGICAWIKTENQTRSTEKSMS